MWDRARRTLATGGLGHAGQERWQGGERGKCEICERSRAEMYEQELGRHSTACTGCATCTVRVQDAVDGQDECHLGLTRLMRMGRCDDEEVAASENKEAAPRQCDARLKRIASKRAPGDVLYQQPAVRLQPVVPRQWAPGVHVPAGGINEGV